MTEITTPIEFLQWLRPGGPWYLSAAAPNGWTTKYFTDTKKMEAWVKARDGKMSMYYAVNPLRPEYTADKNAEKTDVAAMEFLHVDMDSVPGKDPEAERRRHLKLLDDFEHAPTIVINSGNGLNALWRLDEPVLAPADGDWSQLEAYNKHLEDLLANRQCHNINRVLRLPYTWNIPTAKKLADGRKQEWATIIAHGGQSYPLNGFRAAEDGLTEQSEPVLSGSTHENTELSEQLAETIRSGDASAWGNDHSRMIVAVALGMLHEGAGRDEIEATLLDPTNGVSDHCLRQDNKERAAKRAVDAALKTVEDQKSRNTAIFTFANKALADEHYASTVASMLVGTRLTKSKKNALIEIVKKRSGEPKADIKEMFKERTPKPRKATEFLEAHVYVTMMKNFIHRESLREYDREQFENTHSARWPIRDKGPTAATVFINDGGRQIYKATYRPGREEFIDDEYNLWRATGVEPTYGDVTSWLEHAAYLIPDQRIRDIFFDRMAFDVQRPDQKPNWHCFLGGMQGIGKNMFLQPIIAALGEDNCRTVTPDVLNSPYGDWLQGRKVIFIDEMMSFAKKDMNNKLKPRLAAPPWELWINKKYGGMFDLPNLLSFYFGSNFEDPMSVEKGDRRLFMYWSAVEPRNAAHYEKTWKWLDDHVSDAVGFLMKRDLSGFNALGIAPMTEFKEEVIKSSEKPLVMFLLEALKSRTWPLQEDLVSVNRLLTCNFPHGLGAVNPSNLGRALKKIGGEKLDRIVLADGTKPMIWAVRDIDEYVQMGPEKLRVAVAAALMRGDRESSPF